MTARAHISNQAKLSRVPTQHDVFTASGLSFFQSQLPYKLHFPLIIQAIFLFCHSLVHVHRSHLNGDVRRQTALTGHVFIMETCAIGLAVSQALQTRVRLWRDESLINMPLLIHEHERTQSKGEGRRGEENRKRERDRQEGARRAGAESWREDGSTAKICNATDQQEICGKSGGWLMMAIFFN